MIIIKVETKDVLEENTLLIIELRNSSHGTVKSGNSRIKIAKKHFVVLTMALKIECCFRPYFSLSVDIFDFLHKKNPQTFSCV